MCWRNASTIWTLLQMMVAEESRRTISSRRHCSSLVTAPAVTEHPMLLRMTRLPVGPRASGFVLVDKGISIGAAVDLETLMRRYHEEREAKVARAADTRRLAICSVR